MNNEISQAFEALIAPLMDLRDKVERIGTEESNKLSDELSTKLKTLIAFHIRREFQYLYAITGPQGTGKSHLANNIFGLDKSNRLPSMAGRCEKTPVILTFLKESDNKEKPVTKIKFANYSTPITGTDDTTLINNVLYWEVEDLTYEEAQESVLNDDAIIYIWRVPYNPNLQKWVIGDNKQISLSPSLSLLVLPGIEEEQGWSEFAKQSLSISDAVINVIDHPNYATANGKKLLKFIKKNNFNSPIIAVSYSDTINDKKEFEKRIKLDTGIETICFIDLPEKGKESLGKAIFDGIINNSSYLKSSFNIKAIKLFLREIKYIIRDIKPFIKQDFDSFEYEHLLDKMLEKFRESRKHQEEILFNKLDQSLNSYLNKVLDEQEKITKIVNMFGGESDWNQFWNNLLGNKIEDVGKAEKLFFDHWSGEIYEGNRKLTNAISDCISEFALQTFKNEENQQGINSLDLFFERNIALSLIGAEDASKRIGKILNESQEIKDEITKQITNNIDFVKKTYEANENFIKERLLETTKRAKKNISNPSILKKIKYTFSSKNEITPVEKGGLAAGATTALSLPAGIILSEVVLISLVGFGAFYVANVSSMRNKKLNLRSSLIEQYKNMKYQTFEQIKKQIRFYLDQTEYSYKAHIENSLGKNDELLGNFSLAVSLTQTKKRIDEVIENVMKYE